MLIVLDKWLPDFLPFNLPPGGVSSIKNLLPADEYFIPARDKQVYSLDATSDTPVKAITVFAAVSGIYLPFIGTLSKIYRMEATKYLTDVSGTTYSGENWNFVEYGNWLVATNYADAIQVIKDLTAGSFSNLGGAPPRAKYMLLKNGHLILANLYDSGTYAERIKWSAKEDIENWEPALATGADYQDLPFGEIVGLANMGKFFALFHEKAVTIGWYSGYPYTFSFDTAKYKDVKPIRNTMVSYQDAVFYWGEGDIYRLDEMGNTPIGGGVRKYILESLNYSYLNRIDAQVDPVNGLIAWAYPSTSSTDGTPDRILYLNPRNLKYTLVEVDTNCIFQMRDTGTFFGYVDDWDTLYPSFDDIAFPLDSGYLGTNSPVFGCMGTDKKISTFNGNVMTGEIKSGDVPFGNVTDIVNIQPKLKNLTGATVNVKAEAKYSINGSVLATQDGNMDTDGNVCIRIGGGKFYTFTITTQEQEGILGLEVEEAKRGKR